MVISVFVSIYICEPLSHPFFLTSLAKEICFMFPTLPKMQEVL